MALPEVGVKAIVEGLSSFQSDMGKLNSSLQQLRPEATFVQKAFAWMTEGIANFGASVVRVAEVALGVLLRDAVRAAVDFMKELVSATIEAGNEFQVLELRLERLNFNELIDSGKSYSQASKEAIELTKEQLAWVQKLAAQSPYDSTDVANTYTLARSYGFSAEEAQKLTEDILDFSAGMGLTNQQMERIIVNFGQLRAQGKINSQELRDLARGAFVPVNDVLKIMMERMTDAGTITQDFSEEISDLEIKINDYYNDLAVLEKKQEEYTDTTKESTKLANTFKIDELRRKIGDAEAMLSDYQSKTGQALEVTADNFDDLKRKGVLTGETVDIFFESFSQLVEDKFVGATEKMSQTFKASTDNVLDLVKGIFGLNVVKPILDVLGQRAAAFANAFTDDPQKWDRIVEAASRLGDALSQVVASILDLAPGVGDITDKIIQIIQNAAIWVEDNRGNIVEFFQNIAATIREEVVPWIRDNLIPAIVAFFTWISENKEAILGFFVDVGKAIIEDLIPFVRDQLIPLFKQFGEWFLANREQIVGLFDKLGDVILQVAESVLPKLQTALKWMTEHPEIVGFIVNLWIQWQIWGTVLNIVGGIIISVIAFVLSLASAISGLIGIVSIVATLFGVAFLPALGIAIAIILSLISVIGIAVSMFFIFYKTIDLIAKWIQQNFAKAIEDIKNQDWGSLGKDIVEGIANGIIENPAPIIRAMKGAVAIAFEAAKTALGIQSPSKLFFDIGANTMEGMALGIQKTAKLAANSMAMAVMQTASVAASPSVTNTSTYNNNYNLTVNSSAAVEPVLQDFEMLTSLAGA